MSPAESMPEEWQSFRKKEIQVKLWVMCYMQLMNFEFPFRAIMRDANFDKTFKIILGENKVRTMSFLNAVLKLSETERIKEIDFMNVSTADRSIRFDVKIEAKCQSYSGNTFIVEMHRLKHIRHLNRWIYYGAKELCKIGEITYARTNSVEFYSSLCPVKVITIMDFEDAELKNSEGYLIHWDITERLSKQRHQIYCRGPILYFHVLKRVYREYHLTKETTLPENLLKHG